MSLHDDPWTLLAFERISEKALIYPDKFKLVLRNERLGTKNIFVIESDALSPNNLKPIAWPDSFTEEEAKAVCLKFMGQKVGLST